MQQKVALTTAHFPVRGRIADMGSGSGRGTYDLASLYHGLQLVGVDINPTSVERARDKYQRPNLSYVVGDIAEMVFAENSLDGILDSSVLHHVTSFNNFDVNRILTTLDNQVAQLKPGGVIIIRDFVIPDGPEQVYLDLPTTGGTAHGAPTELSPAALFELFAETWRSSVNPNGPVPFIRLSSPRERFVRFQLTLRAAAEFVLRKDYRADWETEVLEEYTYLNQGQFESAFRTRGLRIVTSRPLWNPWIVQNRFENKFYLSGLDGTVLPFPPTNYLIVGEKVSSSEGVELVEARSRSLSSPRFLNLTQYRHKETERIFELVERPHQTIDVLPWFERDGQLFVLAKKDFPRPIVNACTEQSRLARHSYSGYITEPISAIVDEPVSDESIKKILFERASLKDADLISIDSPFLYYTSPGGINEQVMANLVQVRALSSFAASFPNYTSFQSAGSVRELDAQQVLRACHVGGMFDARVEINVYRLMRKLGRKLGPWIGAPIKLSEQTCAHNLDEEVFDPPPRVAFERHTNQTVPAFLSVKEGVFVERTQSADAISEVAFEYVLPRTYSLSSVVILPVFKTSERTLVGLETRDLPAVQSFSESSAIVTAPASRVPVNFRHLSELPMFVRDSMRRDFNVVPLNLWELGGFYLTSPGVTPELVYPYVVEIDAGGIASSTLHFVEVEKVLNNSNLIRDAHLLVTSNRLGHALGL